MSFPKVMFLILFSVLAASATGTPTLGVNNPAAPQRLRVRVENQRLRAGQTTKVIVEFLDRDYGQVANDATRVIELGRAASGANSSASGQFDRHKIEVKPGAWFGEASFTSSGTGRLLITANSPGLESGQALVLITATQSASLVTRFVSLFETVAHAQDITGFDISPRELKATADGRHRATFQVSFLEIPRQNTTVRIATNLTKGSILYKGQPVGPVLANIALAEGEDISGDISVVSDEPGDFDVTASVLPNGPTAHARVKFTRPRPVQIIFDADPLTISSGNSDLPLTVRLADDGGFPINPDGPKTIYFSGASESDQIIFKPESVTLGPDQPYATVMFRLKELPPNNETKLLATNDQGLRFAQKSLQIESAIDRILIAGPTQVNCGAEAEYTVYLADKDDRHRTADWNRQIDLNVTGGLLSTAQVVIPKGAGKAVFRYTSSDDSGKYALTASSAGINGVTHSIGVVHPVYWLSLFALFGGALGGVARELDRNKTIGRILPRRNHKQWDTRFAARLVGSLLGALFFYLLYKLGLSPLLGVPSLTVALDPELRLVAFFLGGVGGFAGTLVLTLITKVFLPEQKQQTATAQ